MHSAGGRVGGENHHHLKRARSLFGKKKADGTVVMVQPGASLCSCHLRDCVHERTVDWQHARVPWEVVNASETMKTPKSLNICVCPLSLFIFFPRGILRRSLLSHSGPRQQSQTNYSKQVRSGFRFKSHHSIEDKRCLLSHITVFMVIKCQWFNKNGERRGESEGQSTEMLLVWMEHVCPPHDRQLRHDNLLSDCLPGVNVRAGETSLIFFF